jgi:hypothetical protein
MREGGAVQWYNSQILAISNTNTAVYQIVKVMTLILPEFPNKS